MDKFISTGKQSGESVESVLKSTYCYIRFVTAKVMSYKEHTTNKKTQRQNRHRQYK